MTRHFPFENPGNLLRPLLLTALIALSGTACERAPTSPELDDVAALLSPSHPAAAANARIYGATLPALFRESIANVERIEGRRGVDVLLRDWRSLQEDLKNEAPGTGRAAIQEKLAAIHRAELRVVERALGERVVTRVIGEANVALAEANAQITAAIAAGENMSAAHSVAQQATEKLGRARSALTVSNTREALDAATQAATLVTGLRFYLLESKRVQGLETLYPRAVEQLSAGAAGSDADLQAIDALSARTRQALRAGDRSSAHQLLAETRAQQIRLVLRVYGAQAAADLVERVQHAAESTAVKVEIARRAGRDVARIDRMLREARDMHGRAAAALARGDAATAIDLGSHAAGLINAVQHQTWH